MVNSSPFKTAATSNNLAPLEHLSTRIQSPGNRVGTIESVGILKEVTANTCNIKYTITSKQMSKKRLIKLFSHFNIFCRFSITEITTLHLH